MTAEQRAGLSDAALAMTQPCIDELIKDISRRVQKAGAITDTAEYQIYRAQALGEGKKAIEQAVSKQIGISEEVIASLFEYVADKSLSLDENGSLKRMTEAYTRMTQSKTRELLRDLWADTPEGKVQPLQTAYARAMDFAFRQVATGTLDLNTAIRRAVTPLAKRGLRTIEQKSGRSVGIEYACRRYIMDQLGQLDDEIQHADHDALGCDGWEISAHAACAPDHEPIQGRQYGDAEFEKLNNSLQRRIGHLNCGHTANPIILGVNAPQYTEAQLQKFKDDNERGVVYNGYRYTLYEAGQEQSRIENGIRLIKRQILADEETESPDLQKHQIKLRVVQAEYARFCKAVGLPTRSERLQVAGFGRSQSNRAVWAYKKAAPEQLRDVEIAGHKLYSVTDERIRAVPKPFFQGVSNKVNGLAQEYARGVLKKVQGLEVGTEAVVNFTKDGKCTGYYVGGQNSMKVKPPKMQVPYYSLHNHPSNTVDDLNAYLAAQYAAGTPVQVAYILAAAPIVPEDGAIYFAEQPAQSGSGDPSPTNIRPILLDGAVKDGGTNVLTLPETVYGGSVDAVSGSGERAWKLLTLDGTETWSYEGTSVIEKYGFILRTKDIQTPTWPSQKGQIVCNKYATRSANDTYTVHTGISVEAESHKYFRIYDEAYADKGVDAWKAYLAAQYAAGTPVQVCYKLATPVPFTATGGAALSALDGVNTVITDADSVAVSGRADPIKRIADLEAAVASIE